MIIGNGTKKIRSVSRKTPPAPHRCDALVTKRTQYLKGFVRERIVKDPLSKAHLYWEEAAKCYELAKSVSPTSLSGFYRQAAVQFLFMAEGELKLAERQTRRRDK
jgi:hypothetical protein